MNKRPPLGVIIFGLILIISSVDQMIHIPKFDEYGFINHGLNVYVLKLRFIISWALRIIGLISGIGILFLEERVRKLLLALSVFSILTVFFRHTYSSFVLYTTPIYDQGSVKGLSLESFTWIAVFVRCGIEIIFSSSVIYYFTRPKITKIVITSATK
jgi:hypothetical protein